MLDQLHAAGTASKAAWRVFLSRFMNIIALDSGGTKFALGNVQQEFRNTLKLMENYCYLFMCTLLLYLLGRCVVA